MAIYLLENNEAIPPHHSVLTIGTFDGVHLGHRLILNEVIKLANTTATESTVITFEPHPRKVLDPNHTLQILTPLDEKLNLISKAGIQNIAVTPFTKAFAQLSADEYVVDFLVKKFKPSIIVIGYDHHFGQDRKGDISLLKKYRAEYHFEVHEIPAHIIRDAAISSTRIRKALLEGEVTIAAQMLGRPYSLSGKVLKGQQLGRTIGYPTANILPNNLAQLVPAIGVYAVKVIVEGREFGGMLNIGTRPTVSESHKIGIEVCIFNFDQEIYGKELTLLFIQRLRDEMKFDSLNNLKKAIQKDELEARIILAC